MNGAQVCVLKETNDIVLRGELEGQDGVDFPSQVVMVVLCKFLDEAGKGELAKQKIGGSLVASISMRALVPGRNLWGRLASTTLTAASFTRRTAPGVLFPGPLPRPVLREAGDAASPTERRVRPPIVGWEAAFLIRAIAPRAHRPHCRPAGTLATCRPAPSPSAQLRFCLSTPAASSPHTVCARLT
eukprot:CAMPEP_0198325090 /NCGR_PEP_ID=MMETSP1450-20131203/12909_1 /TAXON_ID=753684 ORGANISM="Madagascaria erythrocladiodes, Strain CCMP3234" /NCGR_SAMPLE_ID=MMETSP1450 /ASSEMBLY_ACC=CAM_ASM_001115 /LENGTH=185 /DNA_ID=CAMNT_0044028935 /DNA_START=166 /DNA_END=720 /DNA_ORIENTATION=-